MSYNLTFHKCVRHSAYIRLYDISNMCVSDFNECVQYYYRNYNYIIIIAMHII